jgi:hypothetical protein
VQEQCDATSRHCAVPTTLPPIACVHVSPDDSLTQAMARSVAAATRLAGIFGNSSFGLYSDDDLQPLETHAAFCISGREMWVRYYERQLVPISIGWGDPHGIEIKFGTRVVPGASDRIALRELTERYMVLHFESDGGERRFYRRR